jgi:transcriptional regulator with XRE-family HTH domain
MRIERQFTIDELAERLALSRSTIYYWVRGTLGVEPSTIKLQRKSNSGQLKGRTWRSKHGVLQVRMGDTSFRARLQAWIDHVRAEWR